MIKGSIKVYPRNETVDRLHTTPKWVPKPEKGADDSLVCDLPSTTLRWMKQRRRADSDQKVVLNHNRERQLREMFQSLDYTKQGEIDMTALTEAVDYVQQKMKGNKDFQNLRDVFLSMDDNGDGTIDFTEFTNGMTGTTQSAFDKATEYDIERLFRYFVEFGELRQRQIALKKLNIVIPTGPKRMGTNSNFNAGNNKVQRQPSKLVKGKDNNNPNSGAALDLQAYQQFKVLFGNPPPPVQQPPPPQPQAARSSSPPPGSARRNNVSAPGSAELPFNPALLNTRLKLAPIMTSTNKIKEQFSRITNPLPRPESPLLTEEERKKHLETTASSSPSKDLKKLQRIERLLDDFLAENNPLPPAHKNNHNNNNTKSSSSNPIMEAIQHSQSTSPLSASVRSRTASTVGAAAPPTPTAAASVQPGTTLPMTPLTNDTKMHRSMSDDSWETTEEDREREESVANAERMKNNLTRISKLSRASRYRDRKNKNTAIFDENYEQKRKEYLELEEKMKTLRRDEFDALSKHYNDLFFMEKRATDERK
jgi:Ca2+-binding EF-hand superfamily protein